MKIDNIGKYIPNTLVAAPGEIELGEKLTPFLAAASEWFEKWFCPLSLISPPESSEDPEDSQDPDTDLSDDGSGLKAVSIYCHAMRIIVTEAYRLAVPQLDLVLTANGFATVDSKNVVPASKARTDRLLAGLLDFRDRNIKMLLYRLPYIDGWIASECADFFRSTLFINPEETDYIFHHDQNIRFPESSWERYMAFHPLIADVEDALADDWFSPELMTALREECLSGNISEKRKSVLVKIKYQIIDYFQRGEFRSRRLADILNIIRYDPKTFPEWIGSKTAENFYPPRFHNRKESSGYFF